MEPISITSLDDPRVDVYRDVRDADLRGREKLFMAESERVVRRLLRTPERLHSIFLSPHKYDRLRDAIEEARQRSEKQRGAGPQGEPFPVYVADVALMSEIAGFLIHRGALAAGYRLPREELTMDHVLERFRNRERLTIVLAEGITNVDNMGGIFRNAAGFGVDGVVLDTRCCDPLYRKAIRVSVGHTLATPYAVSDAWLEDLKRLKREWGLMLLGAESSPPAGTEVAPLWSIPKAARVGVLFGSEATGLGERSIAMCDALIEIPMTEEVPSLNVSTAVAVVLYEMRRPTGRQDGRLRVYGVSDSPGTV